MQRMRLGFIGAGFIAKFQASAMRFVRGADLTGVCAIKGAEELAAYAKGNEKLTIVGGSLGGETLDVAGVQALATLPSLDALRGKIIGLLQAPATKVAGVLQAPAGQLARVFAAYGAKEDGAKAA